MKSKTTKEGHDLSYKQLLIKDSIVNNAPSLIGFFLWISTTILGLNWITFHYGNQDISGLMTIVWFIAVSLPLTRLIPVPTLVYEVSS